MKRNGLIQKLQIDYPIIQAPMAGVTTPLLVAAVSNGGGLGNIGAGYLTAEKVREFIIEVKNKTTSPFGINLFVPEFNVCKEEELRESYQLLGAYRKEFHIEGDEEAFLKMTTDFDKQFDKQIEVILEEKVNVCSFTFGIPTKEIIKDLKKNGSIVIGTATTVQEAQIIQDLGMDAVVVQGSEAGGHRGTFLQQESLIGLMSLLPQVVDHVKIPVIATGGIMDGRGLTAALCLGADAVQLGTAFLTTKESGAHQMYKSAILQATEEDLQLTKAFSGKTARGIKNQFIKEMEEYESALPAYPYQNMLTTKIRQAAALQNNIDYMSLWAGQSPRLSRDVTVQELLDGIIEEAKDIQQQQKLC